MIDGIAVIGSDERTIDTPDVYQRFRPTEYRGQAQRQEAPLAPTPTHLMDGKLNHFPRLQVGCLQGGSANRHGVAHWSSRAWGPDRASAMVAVVDRRIVHRAAVEGISRCPTA